MEGGGVEVRYACWVASFGRAWWDSVGIILFWAIIELGTKYNPRAPFGISFGLPWLPELPLHLPPLGYRLSESGWDS
jgi:hypothetical protein